jgi:hypothetical protein
MTLGIRQRCHVSVGLNEELRSIAADDGTKRIPIRLLKLEGMAERSEKLPNLPTESFSRESIIGTLNGTQSGQA